MQKYVHIWILLLLSASVSAQYRIEVVTEAACTGIKDQQNTGTCWSFATCSFIESELLRQGKGNYDLSEMFIVRNIYMDKAMNYVLRQGKANFSEGSLSHDFISAVDRHGIVPESVFSGRESSDQVYDHGEFVAMASGMLDGLLKRKTLSQRWKEAFSALLEVYFGSAPAQFSGTSGIVTPVKYAEEIGIKPGDYVSITSFTHHPYYTSFILEIPDNFSNGSYYNVKLEELEAIVDRALADGFTIAWDGDVSESGFSASQGLAVLPKDARRDDLFLNPGPEIAVTAESRQTNFESHATTDDHLMHIVGLAKDEAGEKYYKVKNSWGEVGELRGYLYMSAPYFRMKTIAVMVHKDAIPAELKRKLGLDGHM